MKISKATKLRNIPYPGFGACSRCGGSWGWKEGVSHNTSEISGIFLFCEKCDKVVTVEERWKALDDWKLRCIMQVDSIEHAREIMATEFLEWPREVTR